MATSVLTVTVKWRKQAFPDVALDTALPAEVFLSQLYTLTGVPPARQTILGLRGGKKITADADLSKLGIKDRQTLMLLGSPEADTPAAVPATAGSAATHVADDLDLDAPKEDAAALSAAVTTPAIAVPPGLVNMGNTCYMNSVVQVLNRVPELRSALGNYRGGAGEGVLNPSARLTASLRDLLSRLNVRGVAAINPSGFIGALRTANPQFAERAGPAGMFAQQDAEECWGEILTRLSSTLPAPAVAGDAAAASDSGTVSAATAGDASAAASNGSGAGAAGVNAVDSLFGITTVAVDTCTEEGSSETVARRDTVRTLKCHIVQSVNHLADGLSAALSETIDMVSESLGRSARWARVSRLDTLPPYLAVQFVRFAWKPVERVRAKILRNVSFPLTLDVYDFCTDESRARMTGARERARRAADEAAARAATDLEAANASVDAGDSTTAAPAGADVAAATGAAGGAADRTAQESAPAADGGDTAMDTSAPADTNGSSATAVASASGPGEVTGVYELIAVLTHQGRAADGGHYVAWVKADPPAVDATAPAPATGPARRAGASAASAASAAPWIKLDDNKVSLTTAEEVLKLSGGGDWHTAYMLLYRAKRA